MREQHKDPQRDPAQWEEHTRRGRRLVSEKRRLQVSLGDLALSALGPRARDDEALRSLARQIGISPTTEDRAAVPPPAPSVPPGRRPSPENRGGDR
ncbi:hypothetical protein GCM10010425_74470 [Streptomyces spororaveus]|uniref:ANTAR domain-containing protein n=1 Tax=Streptomyces spororaveus TaxID=284039 RepID=A0ABQ3T270_9ACTN|nr:hypothetical protein Sspor_00340 [Streptomyces spororaveus]